MHGLDLRVDLAGDAHAARPLLLIGGIGANIEMWRPLRAVLGPARTVAYDAPGTGRSQAPIVPLRMRGLARVAAGVLDGLGVGEVDVLGYSFGGAVAQQLARDAPGRVRRLILAATHAGAVSLPGNPRAWAHMLTPLRYHSEAHLRRALPAIAGGRTAREPNLVDRYAADRLAAPPSVWGYQSQLFAIAGWTSAAWLARLTQPTLVLAGDDDPLIPLANARFLTRRIPRARLHVVNGGGHLFLIDQPADVAHVVSSFLSEPARRSPP